LEKFAQLQALKSRMRRQSHSARELLFMLPDVSSDFQYLMPVAYPQSKQQLAKP
jgi:hypothetical protein